MNTLSKYKFWIGGAVCLGLVGLVIGAVRPKRVSGAQGAPADVEVVQVEQRDVPIYGEWIGALDGLGNAGVRGAGLSCKCRCPGAGHRLPHEAGLPGRRLRQARAVAVSD